MSETERRLKEAEEMIDGLRAYEREADGLIRALRDQNDSLRSLAHKDAGRIATLEAACVSVIRQAKDHLPWGALHLDFVRALDRLEGLL